MSLSLTVLGTASPHPTPGRACSGYLLRSEHSAVVVDLGPGSLANLQRHQRLDRITAIWLSHLHIDHMADLPSLFYALSYTDLTVPHPIPVYAPSGLADRLAGLFAQPDAHFLDEVFEFHDLRDGDVIDLDGQRLTSVAVEHGMEAYALRAESSSGCLAYSGDCGPCPGLDRASRDVDVLLCESDVTDCPTEAPRWHHTPEDAGALAARAGVGTLLITHIGPFLVAPEAVARASTVFGGRALAAEEGQTYLVG